MLAFTVPRAKSLRRTLGCDVPVGKKKLFGFKRVTLGAGASTTVTFDLEPEQLGMVDADGHGHTGLRSGDFDVVFSRGHGDELVAKASVALADDQPEIIKRLRKWWQIHGPVIRRLLEPCGASDSARELIGPGGFTNRPDVGRQTAPARFQTFSPAASRADAAAAARCEANPPSECTVRFNHGRSDDNTPRVCGRFG